MNLAKRLIPVVPICVIDSVSAVLIYNDFPDFTPTLPASGTGAGAEVHLDLETGSLSTELTDEADFSFSLERPSLNAVPQLSIFSSFSNYRVLIDNSSATGSAFGDLAKIFNFGDSVGASGSRVDRRENMGDFRFISVFSPGMGTRRYPNRGSVFATIPGDDSMSSGDQILGNDSIFVGLLRVPDSELNTGFETPVLRPDERKFNLGFIEIDPTDFTLLSVGFETEALSSFPDGITLIPEPSSSLLLGLAGMLSMTRRRRSV